MYWPISVVLLYRQPNHSLKCLIEWTAWLYKRNPIFGSRLSEYEAMDVELQIYELKP